MLNKIIFSVVANIIIFISYMLITVVAFITGHAWRDFGNPEPELHVVDHGIIFVLVTVAAHIYFKFANDKGAHQGMQLGVIFSTVVWGISSALGLAFTSELPPEPLWLQIVEIVLDIVPCVLVGYMHGRYENIARKNV